MRIVLPMRCDRLDAADGRPASAAATLIAAIIRRGWRLPLFIALAAFAGCQAPQSAPLPEGAPEFSDAKFNVRPVESALDFGEIPTNESKTAQFTLVNVDKKPHDLLQTHGGGGGNVFLLKRALTLPPRRVVPFNVTVSGGMTPGPIKGKSVIVVVEGQPNIVIPVKATAVSAVVMEPLTVNLRSNPEGRFTLRSIDGEPFRILDMEPAIFNAEPDAAPKAAHDLTIDLAKLKDLAGMRHRLTFHLDHPRCGVVNGLLLADDHTAEAPATMPAPGGD